MTNIPDDEEFETPAEQADNARFRALREKAKKADSIPGLEAERADALARAEKAEKELLFHQVGLDPSKGVANLFFTSYTGELTADAVRTAAAQYDLIQSSVPAEEEAAHRTATEAASGETAEDEVATLLAKLDAIPEVGADPAFEWKAKQAVLKELADAGVKISRTKPAKLSWVDVQTPVTPPTSW